jgi:hypothetical protein
MSFPISHLYPLFLVLWVIVFWSRSNVFRSALLISLAFHAIFLVRVSGLGAKKVQPERIISFTFVQGGQGRDESSSERPVGPSPQPSPIAKETAVEDSEAEQESPVPPQEALPRPVAQRIEKNLPRIEDASLLDFSADPLAEDYRRALQRLIQRYQQTPPEIFQRGVEARVKVWFNLSRDGKLNQPIFVDPKIRSSDDIVNKAAIDSVVAAAEHFPPLPRHINRPEMWFYVYVDYGPAFGGKAFSGDSTGE